MKDPVSGSMGVRLYDGACVLQLDSQGKGSAGARVRQNKGKGQSEWSQFI